MPKELLRVGEVADALGYSRAHVYRLIAEGSLPAVHQGRAVHIPRRAWERWLDQRSATALAAVKHRPEG